MNLGDGDGVGVNGMKMTACFSDCDEAVFFRQDFPVIGLVVPVVIPSVDGLACCVHGFTVGVESLIDLIDEGA